MIWLICRSPLLGNIVNEHFDARDVVRTTTSHDYADARTAFPKRSNGGPLMRCYNMQPCNLPLVLSSLLRFSNGDEVICATT